MPPFTQLNTPYPSICYLRRYLSDNGFECSQTDLSIELFLKIFSAEGLSAVFRAAERNRKSLSSNVYNCREKYTDTVEPVISFLQNKNPSAAYKICSRNYLPESRRFAVIDEMESFHETGISDRAKFISTLFIEDICDFITEYVDSNFSISRYAEKTGIMANDFSSFGKTLGNDTVITEIYYSLLQEKFSSDNYDLAAVSVPFPGNLHFAFKTGAWIKKNYPSVKVAMGGGFINTELRGISNTAVFNYTDFITLDDGELPLQRIISGELPLIRTFCIENGVIKYHSDSENITADEGNWSDYTGLNLENYLSLVEIINPMHRLWSEGHWNKMTLAHGCYWHKCAFCDTSLDYISRFEPCSAGSIIKKIKQLQAETCISAFHFTDEAAPPALLKNFCKALLKEKIDITWWTNIRFEKNFTPDLCRLMAEAGCIAVAGGIEVASERVLKLIDKGVTLSDAVRVSHNFSSCGIMTHAYLMYGFPTQTGQEVIDSLETVRQMFLNGCLSSAFWHQYTMTAHSPTGINPEKFGTAIAGPEKSDFAYNDLIHEDISGIDYTKYSSGLKKSVYNYMYGNLLEADTSFWFDFKTRRPEVRHDAVSKIISDDNGFRDFRDTSEIFWIGGRIVHDGKALKAYDRSGEYSLKAAEAEKNFIILIPEIFSLSGGKVMQLRDFRAEYKKHVNLDPDQFLKTGLFNDLRELGLIIL